MYWTDPGYARIQRANLDGTSVEDLVTTGLSDPVGIALDLAAGKMYWTDAGTSKIQRANLDGSVVEDLVTGIDQFFGIALDLAAGKMYWGDILTNKIKRANLDGSSLEDLVTAGVDFPSGIALDVPKPISVKPFVFLANKITLKRTKQNTPGGDMHSNGTLTVEKGDPSTYNSNLTAVGKITINKENTINGNVKAPSVSNSGTINGTKTIGPVANEPLPSLSYGPISGPNKTVAKGKSLTLAPDDYGIVTINSGGTLKLSSGEYFMKELRGASSGIVIEIDLSSGDPVTINIQSNLQLGKEAEIRLLPNGESDSKLVTFNTLQTSSVNFGKEAYLLGSFNAPNAKVTLVKNTQLRGSITAKEILVERDCLFLHHDSPGSLPGPGDLPKPSFEEEEVTRGQSPVTSYELSQNYPNPFNPSTTISFQLPVASDVTLSIYNTTGQLVRKLVAGEMGPGRHNLVWDATDAHGQRVASGVYLYVLKAGEFVAQRKLVLMK
ncbi:T9SS type A sorting domain-containing protein, partial [bacterium]|nr:T9SS type A sorting domain-containing protein [bacterium]